MGLINFGVPKKEVEFLQNNYNLDIFVEGGTYKGDTAKSMSKKFKKIFTIEKSDVMYNVATENLKSSSNVELLKGDTRDHLKYILKNNDNLLFWLDAHWSGGDTYGEEDECPLIKELEIIFQYNKNYIILIDDARLFLAPPPQPHKIINWPTLTDILQVLPKNWELLELEDVIYLFPEENSKKLKEFMQEITTDRWNKYGEKKNKYRFFRNVKIAILILLKPLYYKLKVRS